MITLWLLKNFIKISFYIFLIILLLPLEILFFPLILKELRKQKKVEEYRRQHWVDSLEQIDAFFY